MSEEEFKALTEDIRTNGLRVPIVIYLGQILDGRHRYGAAMEAKITLTEKDFVEFKPTGKDTAIKFVVSQNVNRRHLNESQRALIAGELANGMHGGDRSKTSIDVLNEDQAAKLLNVGKASVQRAKKVLAGTPALANAVRKGDIKVSAAEKFAASDKQDELLKKTGGDIVKAVKALNENTDTPATMLWNAMKSKFEKMKLDELEATVKVLSDNLATYLKAKKDLAEAEKKIATAA
jgi:ParB-like chromosome segregation protein Spo0J